MIRVAFVAPSNEPRVGWFKGRAWIDRQDGSPVDVQPLESITGAGARLELQALLGRLVGEDIEIGIMLTKYGTDSGVLSAMVESLPGLVPVVQTTVGARQIGRGDNGFTPFDRGFRGRRFVDFQPPWQEVREAPSLLRSVSVETYAFPATDEDDEPTNQLPKEDTTNA